MIADLRYSFRQLRKAPGFTATALATIAICLGANLARREISVAFDELRRQMPDIQATDEPSRLLSPFIHGIKRLPVSWTPPR